MRLGFCFWGRSNSGEIARNRLKLLLVSDQVGLSLGLLDQIREDMKDVLSRYAEIDCSRIEIRLMREKEEEILSASFPVREFTNKRN
ncbi:cell division topological specificity factor MinE [Brotaphodocola sp.]|uniref:cell division topological specificity factor MinE n=1 Tax=Brotaphodocola sp. TaxID=3073577 RepID=UPI003D7DB2C4